jgi:hypothetical protein
MKRAQKEYEGVFTELREAENEYYDLLRDVVRLCLTSGYPQG